MYASNKFLVKQSNEPMRNESAGNLSDKIGNAEILSFFLFTNNSWSVAWISSGSVLVGRKPTSFSAIFMHIICLMKSIFSGSTAYLNLLGNFFKQTISLKT